MSEQNGMRFANRPAPAVQAVSVRHDEKTGRRRDRCDRNRGFTNEVDLRRRSNAAVDPASSARHN